MSAKHINKMKDKLVRMGFRAGFGAFDMRNNIYLLPKGRADFFARPMVEDGFGYYLFGIAQVGTNREKMRWFSVKEEHIEKRLADYLELLEVKSLRGFKGQVITRQLYELLTKNRRVIVRVLKTGPCLNFREIKMNGQYIRADYDEYQCFVNAIMPGSYTMLKDDWERIKFLTKFL